MVVVRLRVTLWLRGANAHDYQTYIIGVGLSGISLVSTRSLQPLKYVRCWRWVRRFIRTVLGTQTESGAVGQNLGMSDLKLKILEHFESVRKFETPAPHLYRGSEITILSSDT